MMTLSPDLTVFDAVRLAAARGFALRAARRPGQKFGFTLKPVSEKK